jgi:ribosomal-protein-alanine N-acetyltransferase
MAKEDRTRSVSRRPITKALRNYLGRLIRVTLGERRLEMPALETERLLLRKFVQDDLNDIIVWGAFAVEKSPEIQAQEFLDYCFREYRERGIGPWAMQLKEVKAIVGNCGFPHVYFKSLCGEVNYYVSPPHRGKGLATEALKGLLRIGFKQMGLTRIQGQCELDNLSSERVLQKAGMRFERRNESSSSPNETSRNEKVYAIFVKEFDLAAQEMTRD